MTLLWSVWMLLQLVSIPQTVGQTTATGSTTPPLPEPTPTSVSTAQLHETQTVVSVTRTIQSTESALEHSETVSSESPLSILPSNESSPMSSSSIPSDSSSGTLQTLVYSSFGSTVSISESAAVQPSLTTTSAILETLNTDTVLPETLHITSTSNMSVSKTDIVSHTLSTNTLAITAGELSSHVPFDSSAEMNRDSVDSAQTITPSPVLSSYSSMFYPGSSDVSYTLVSSIAFTRLQSVDVSSTHTTDSIQTFIATTIKYLQDSDTSLLETSFSSIDIPENVSTTVHSGSYMDSSSLVNTTGSIRTVSTLYLTDSINLVQTPVSTIDKSAHSVNSTTAKSLKSSDEVSSIREQSFISTPNSIYAAYTIDQTVTQSSSLTLETVPTSQSIASDYPVTEKHASLPISNLYSSSIIVLSHSTESYDTLTSISVISPTLIYSSSLYIAENVIFSSFSTVHFESNVIDTLSSQPSKSVMHESISPTVKTLSSNSRSNMPTATVLHEQSLSAYKYVSSSADIPSRDSSSRDFETITASQYGRVSTISKEISLSSNIIMLSPSASPLISTRSEYSYTTSTTLPNSLSTLLTDVNITSSKDHDLNTVHSKSISDSIDSTSSTTTSFALDDTTSYIFMGLSEQLNSSLSSVTDFVVHMTTSQPPVFSSLDTNVISALSTSASTPMSRISSSLSSKLTTFLSLPMTMTLSDSKPMSSLSFGSVSGSTSLSTDQSSLFFATSTTIDLESVYVTSVSGNIKPTETLVIHSTFSGQQTLLSQSASVNSFEKSEVFSLSSVQTVTIQPTISTSPILSKDIYTSLPNSFSSASIFTISPSSSILQNTINVQPSYDQTNITTSPTSTTNKTTEYSTIHADMSLSDQLDSSLRNLVTTKISQIHTVNLIDTSFTSTVVVLPTLTTFSTVLSKPLSLPQSPTKTSFQESLLTVPFSDSIVSRNIHSTETKSLSQEIAPSFTVSTDKISFESSYVQTVSRIITDIASSNFSNNQTPHTELHTISTLDNSQSVEHLSSSVGSETIQQTVSNTILPSTHAFITESIKTTFHTISTGSRSFILNATSSSLIQTKTIIAASPTTEHGFSLSHQPSQVYSASSVTNVSLAPVPPKTTPASGIQATDYFSSVTPSDTLPVTLTQVLASTSHSINTKGIESISVSKHHISSSAYIESSRILTTRMSVPSFVSFNPISSMSVTPVSENVPGKSFVVNSMGTETLSLITEHVFQSLTDVTSISTESSPVSISASPSRVSITFSETLKHFSAITDSITGYLSPVFPTFADSLTSMIPVSNSKSVTSVGIINPSKSMKSETLTSLTKHAYPAATTSMSYKASATTSDLLETPSTHTLMHSLSTDLGSTYRISVSVSFTDSPMSITSTNDSNESVMIKPTTSMGTEPLSSMSGHVFQTLTTITGASYEPSFLVTSNTRAITSVTFFNPLAHSLSSTKMDSRYLTSSSAYTMMSKILVSNSDSRKSAIVIDATKDMGTDTLSSLTGHTSLPVITNVSYEPTPMITRFSPTGISSYVSNSFAHSSGMVLDSLYPSSMFITSSYSQIELTLSHSEYSVPGVVLSTNSFGTDTIHSPTSQPIQTATSVTSVTSSAITSSPSTGTKHTGTLIHSSNKILDSSRSSLNVKIPTEFSAGDVRSSSTNQVTEYLTDAKSTLESTNLSVASMSSLGSHKTVYPTRTTELLSAAHVFTSITSSAITTSPSMRINDTRTMIHSSKRNLDSSRSSLNVKISTESSSGDVRSFSTNQVTEYLTDAISTLESTSMSVVSVSSLGSVSESFSSSNSNPFISSLNSISTSFMVVDSLSLFTSHKTVYPTRTTVLSSAARVFTSIASSAITTSPSMRINDTRTMIHSSKRNLDSSRSSLNVKISTESSSGDVRSFSTNQVTEYLTDAISTLESTSMSVVSVSSLGSVSESFSSSNSHPFISSLNSISTSFMVVDSLSLFTSHKTVYPTRTTELSSAAHVFTSVISSAITTSPSMRINDTRTMIHSSNRNADSSYSSLIVKNSAESSTAAITSIMTNQVTGYLTDTISTLNSISPSDASISSLNSVSADGSFSLSKSNMFISSLESISTSSMDESLSFVTSHETVYPTRTTESSTIARVFNSSPISVYFPPSGIIQSSTNLSEDIWSLQVTSFTTFSTASMYVVSVTNNLPSALHSSNVYLVSSSVYPSPVPISNVASSMSPSLTTKVSSMLLSLTVSSSEELSYAQFTSNLATTSGIIKTSTTVKSVIVSSTQDSIIVDKSSSVSTVQKSLSVTSLLSASVIHSNNYMSVADTLSSHSFEQLVSSELTTFMTSSGSYMSILISQSSMYSETGQSPYIQSASFTPASLTLHYTNLPSLSTSISASSAYIKAIKSSSLDFSQSSSDVVTFSNVPPDTQLSSHGVSTSSFEVSSSTFASSKSVSTSPGASLTSTSSASLTTSTEQLSSGIHLSTTSVNSLTGDITEIVVTKTSQTSAMVPTSISESRSMETYSPMLSLDTQSQSRARSSFSSMYASTSVTVSIVIPSIVNSPMSVTSGLITLLPSTDISISLPTFTSTWLLSESIMLNETQLLTTLSSYISVQPSSNFTTSPTSLSSILTGSSTTPSPTTNVPPTGTTLNASRAGEPFWVRTVLKIRSGVIVTGETFKADLEERLATAYNEAFTRERLIREGKFEPLRRRRRRKRYTTVGDAAVHLHEISREQGTSSVSAIYSVERSGKVLTAAEAVAALDTLDTQEVAIILGQVLQIKAETYIKSESPEPSDTGSKLWLVAAILGPLVAFVVFIWIVLCIYFKCCRRKTTDEDEPRLTSIQESPRRVKELSSVQEPRPHPDKRLPHQSSKSSLKPKVRAYEVTPPVEPDVIHGDDKTKSSPSKSRGSPVSIKSIQNGAAVKGSPGNSLAPPKPKKGKRNRRNSIEPLAQDVPTESTYHSDYLNEQIQLLHSSLSDDNEELQERARIERRRNKDRLREKRRKERGDDPRVSDYVTSQNHLNKLGLPSTSLPSVYVESGSPVKEATVSRQDSGVYNGHVSPEENLEEARSRMHSLLDQAFSLISPRASMTDTDIRHKKQLSQMSTTSSHNTTGVKENNERGSKWSISQDTEKGKDIKHEPMFVNPMHSDSYSDFPLETWSPYRTSDQVALISMPQRLEPEPVRLGQKSDNRPASSKPGKRPAASFDFNESKSTSALGDAKYTTSPAKPIILKTKDLQNTKTDSVKANGTKSNRQYSVTGINGDVYLTGSTTSLSAPKSKNNKDNMEMKTYQNGSTKKHNAPSRDLRNSDEVDIINTLKPGETSDNLLQSLRDELSVLKESYKPETKPGRRKKSSARSMTEIV